jgi:hypothetical protein
MSSEEKKKEKKEEISEVFLGGEVKQVPLTTAAEPQTPAPKAKKGDESK